MGKRIAGLEKDTPEIVSVEGSKLYAQGKSSLEFRNEVAGLLNIKSTGGNKKNVGRIDDAKFGGNARALDNWQNIPLYALP